MTHPDGITVIEQTIDRVRLRWGDRLVDLPADTRILGCRFLDWSGDPDDVRAIADALEAEAPLDPGWRAFDCTLCGRQVRMGVRQQTIYSIDPAAFRVACLLCAAIFQHVMDNLFGHGFVQVEHAGGR